MIEAMTYDWRGRHMEARMAPAPGDETRLVVLIDALDKAIDHHLEGGGSFPDEVASEGFGSMLEGFIQLLNFGTGRLDAGSLWDEAALLAERVAWDLDLSKIIWETSSDKGE